MDNLWIWMMMDDDGWIGWIGWDFSECCLGNLFLFVGCLGICFGFFGVFLCFLGIVLGILFGGMLFGMGPRYTDFDSGLNRK